MDYSGMSSQELIDIHRLEQLKEDPEWGAMWELHRRGGSAEFQFALNLSASKDAVDRITAADLLGQLGINKPNSQPTFLNESVDILTTMLSDSDPGVVGAAAMGLGHRLCYKNDTSRAVAALVVHSHSPHAEVRYAVVHALLGDTDPVAIVALIELSADEDSDVRNWATFGLGSQIDIDTPQIRETLALRLSDGDYEVRSEAIAGLAGRGDERAYTALARELGEMRFVG
jgi:HEAT repeat protein